MSASGAQDEEPGALWARFATHREAGLRERLIQRYLPLARATAARVYRSRLDDSVPFNDYLQYARLGLLEAIDRYNPEREASFATFSSYRIRGAILNGLSEESEVAAQRKHWRAQVRDRMESLKLGVPSPEGVADERAEARTTDKRTTTDESSELQELVDLTVGLALGFMLEQEDETADESTQANPYAATELAELGTVVRRLVTKLPERERSIVESHYFRQQEFQEIAVEWRVTKGRVSQLHAQALARIRKALEAPPAIDRKA